MHIKVSIWND